MIINPADAEHRKKSLEYLRHKHVERLQFKDKLNAYYDRTTRQKEESDVLLVLIKIVYNDKLDVQFPYGVSIGTTPARIPYKYIQQAVEMKQPLKFNEFALALKTNDILQIIDANTKLISSICCEIAHHVQDQKRVEISIDQLDATRDFWNPIGKTLFIDRLMQIYIMYLVKRAPLYHLICMYNMLKQYNEINHINSYSNMNDLYDSFIEKKEPIYKNYIFIFR